MITQKIHCYCFSCGKKFEQPQIYKNCRTCSLSYKRDPDKLFDTCKLCGCKTPLDKNRLCKTCYYKVRSLDLQAVNDLLNNRS